MKMLRIICGAFFVVEEASAKLAAMGYTNIVEFGGILDWTGEVER